MQYNRKPLLLLVIIKIDLTTFCFTKRSQLSSNCCSRQRASTNGVVLLWFQTYSRAQGRMPDLQLPSNPNNTPIQSIPPFFIPHFFEIDYINLFQAAAFKMNTDLSTLIEDSFTINSCDFSIECLRVTPSKKKNYSGLQDDSRKKSKKKHWKPQENSKYVQFLRENMSLFEKNREDKRLMKINILMSNYVKSKNSTQCRSHHQKMLAHYKTIENVIVCLNTQAENEMVNVKEVETIPVMTQEEFLEENSGEFEEVYEEKSMFQKDVFEVLDLNCWGYMDLASMEKM